MTSRPEFWRSLAKYCAEQIERMNREGDSGDTSASLEAMAVIRLVMSDAAADPVIAASEDTHALAEALATSFSLGSFKAAIENMKQIADQRSRGTLH